jgi:seryl-tRNA synthetase
VELHETNKQWMLMACSVKELWEELEKLLKEAEEITSLIKLPLPDYMYQILPNLHFLPAQASEPLKYQFQPWFDPKAHQAQWHHTE